MYRYFAYLAKTASIVDYVKDPIIIMSTQEEIVINNRNIVEENVVYMQELYRERKALLKFKLFNDVNEILANRDVYPIHQFPPLKNQLNSKIITLSVPEQPLEITLKLIVKELKEHKVVLCINEKEIKIIVEQLILMNIAYQMIDCDSPIPQGLSLCVYPLVEALKLLIKK